MEMISDGHYSDDEDVFFGEISERERHKSNMYARRKTALYVPGFRQKQLMEHSCEMEEDAPMVAGYESMSSPPSMVGFNIMPSPPFQSVPENSPAVPDNSPGDPDQSLVVAPSSDSKFCVGYPFTEGHSPVCKMPLNIAGNKEYSPMPRECDSRLWDSGVECGTVDCSVRSTPMSCNKTGNKLAVDNMTENEVASSTMKPLKELVNSSFDVTREVVNDDAKDCVMSDAEIATSRVVDSQVQPDLLAKHIRRSLTFSESGMESEVSVQDESKTSMESLRDCQKPVVPTTVSTPRMYAVPTLDFSSPHLLVSPIAKYKTGDSLKRADTKLSMPSSKLVLSSASAFQRVSSHQAVRRSLRKKTMDEDSINNISQMTDMNLSSCTSENDVPSCGTWPMELSTRQTPLENRHSIACIENMVTGFRNTINELTKSISQLNERLTESSVMTSSKNCLESGKSASCDMVEMSGNENYLDSGEKLISPRFKSRSDNVLSLPSTLAGQQLLYIKSRELSLMNLESSPDSAQSNCSTTTQHGLRVSSSDSSGVQFHGHQLPGSAEPVYSSAKQNDGVLFHRQQFPCNAEPIYSSEQQNGGASFHRQPLPCNVESNYSSEQQNGGASFHRQQLPCNAELNYSSEQQNGGASFHRQQLPCNAEPNYSSEQVNGGVQLHRQQLPFNAEPVYSSTKQNGAVVNVPFFVNGHIENELRTNMNENSYCESLQKPCDRSSFEDIPYIDGAPAKVCTKNRSPSPPSQSVDILSRTHEQIEPSETVRCHRPKTKRKYVAETSRLSWTETNYFDSDSSSSELSDCYNGATSSESDSSSLLDYSASDSFDFNPALRAATDDRSKERLSTLETNIDVVSTKPSSKGKLVRQRSFQEKLRNFKDKLVPRKKKSVSKCKMKVDKENTPADKKKSFPKTPRSLKNGAALVDLSGVDVSPCLKEQVNSGSCSAAPDVTQYKKKAPQRWRKPDGFTSLSPTSGKKSKSDEHVERMTQLHTMCNGQRIVRYLNFSQSPMIIKHYPPPKEASKVSWCESVIEEDATFSPVSSPPQPKPILQQKPYNHLYPFVGDVPSPIILTRTRRAKTLFRKVTQL